MELYGRSYVVEHCVSERLKQDKEKLYRAYVTDALKIIAENTTHYQGAEEMFDYGSTLNARWIDVLEPQKEEPTDDRSCEEIVDDIWERIRGTGNDSI